MQGGCFGGGTGVISACDVVIAADNALFSITEVRWGLTAAIIIPQLCDAIGVRQVRRYALTGERFGAEEARRIGLVHEVVPLAELEAAGAKVVEQLLANGPEALAETKALAMESSFGGMSVDDEAYARLVRMHSAQAPDGGGVRGPGLVRRKARGELGRQEIAQLNSPGRCRAGSCKRRRPPAASAAAIRASWRRGWRLGLALRGERGLLALVAGFALGLGLDEPALLHLRQARERRR